MVGFFLTWSTLNGWDYPSLLSAESILCLPCFEHMGLHSFFKSFRIRGTWLIKGMSFFVSQVWYLFADTITDTMNGTAQNTVLFHIFLIKMLQSTKKEYNFNLPLWLNLSSLWCKPWKIRTMPDYIAHVSLTKVLSTFLMMNVYLCTCKQRKKVFESRFCVIEFYLSWYLKSDLFLWVMLKI